jgi:hypothetical protein
MSFALLIPCIGPFIAVELSILIYVVIVVGMTNKRTGFYKGITGFRRGSEEFLYEAVEHSIYQWWWEFLRLSPVFWYAQHADVTPVVPKVAEVCEQAGDVREDRFNKWWRGTGSVLFEEARRPLQLRRVDEQTLGDHEFYPQGKSMLVEVPLTATSRTLVKQFKKLLAQTHGNQRVDVLEHSNAAWKLHTKRYNLVALENQFWVLIYRLLYPDIAAWRIGDRLQISPGLKLRDIDRQRYAGKTSPISRAQSTVGRFLYKAQRTVANAELASFPNFNQISAADMPFGEHHHKNFLIATRGTVSEPSAWQQWLHEEFHWRLVKRIKEKNRIAGMTAVDPKVVQRLSKFIAGESDLLS